MNNDEEGGCMDAELGRRLALLLDRVEHWLPPVPEKVDWNAKARAEAVRFATLRGGRSGRAAWQFATQWVGRKRLHSGA